MTESVGWWDRRSSAMHETMFGCGRVRMAKVGECHDGRHAEGHRRGGVTVRHWQHTPVHDHHEVLPTAGCVTGDLDGGHECRIVVHGR